MFLLDTNVLSELRKVGEQKADPNVTAWASGLHPSQTFISVITVMEIEIGIARLERRDPQQGQKLRRWFINNVLTTFEDSAIPVCLKVSRRCAALHVPDPKSERDALIAATALEHGLTVATRNVGDFAYTGVKLINPWDPIR
jgi:predicted nucleic acid-binding protein